jgi:PAS domain S-box-containing protein
MQATPHPSEKAKRCRRILDRTADYVVLVTDLGTIDYVSPAVERLLGYTPDELIGTDAFEHVHPDDVEQVEEDFETKLDNPGVETSVTYRVRASDGEYRWAEARGRNYLDDPVIEGILLSVRDITDRKRKIEKLIAERDTRSTLQNELATAASVPAFATTVCEELTDMDAIAFARATVGSPEGAGEPLATSGKPSQSENGDGSNPLSVPIGFEGVTRGTLSTQLARPVEDEEEVRELLTESADLLGYAIADEERRQALAAEEWVQFTVTVDSTGTPLSRVVATTDSPVTMTAAIPHDDRQALCYLSPEDPAAFVDAAGGTPGVDRVQRVGEERVQVFVTELCPGDVVTTHGGAIREARVEATTTTLTIRFPDREAFDPVLKAFTAQFDDVAISEFTTSESDSETDGDPLAGLTDRQREVLEVAYRSGYFEKPRTNDATGVAETLDIARPTYDEILRAAQRNLLTELFETE